MSRHASTPISQAGPFGECADGVTVRVGVAEEDFEGAFFGGHFFEPRSTRRALRFHLLFNYMILQPVGKHLAVYLSRSNAEDNFHLLIHACGNLAAI